jgi:hypothetical protein
MSSTKESPEVGIEAEVFLRKLMEAQAQIGDAVKRAVSYYEELSPTTRAKLKEELSHLGGFILFGGLLVPPAVKEKLGITDPMSTMHGVSGGGAQPTFYQGGVSLCGDIKADTMLAMNLLLNLGPKTGLNGMLLLNSVLCVVSLLQGHHLGGQKAMLEAALAGFVKAAEAASKAADDALLAKAKETGSA